jgi:hypothetical protein
LPLTSANNLSNPMRSLLPAATMMAVSMDKSLNRQIVESSNRFTNLDPRITSPAAFALRR